MGLVKLSIWLVTINSKRKLFSRQYIITVLKNTEQRKNCSNLKKKIKSQYYADVNSRYITIYNYANGYDVVPII